jgi:hypothetical protein
MTKWKTAKFVKQDEYRYFTPLIKLLLKKLTEEEIVQLS